MIAVYEIATGRLRSLASSLVSVANPLPAGLATKDVGAVNLQTEMWDEVTQTFVPRPAPTHGALYNAATTLIQKQPADWTNADVANALRILLAGMRDLVT